MAVDGSICAEREESGNIEQTLHVVPFFSTPGTWVFLSFKNKIHRWDLLGVPNLPVTKKELLGHHTIPSPLQRVLIEENVIKVFLRILLEHGISVSRHNGPYYASDNDEAECISDRCMSCRLCLHHLDHIMAVDGLCVNMKGRQGCLYVISIAT